jgi:hypothetical protein
MTDSANLFFYQLFIPNKFIFQITMSWAKQEAKKEKDRRAALIQAQQETERFYFAEFSRLSPLVERLLTDVGLACFGRTMWAFPNFEIDTHCVSEMRSQWLLCGPKKGSGKSGFRYDNYLKVSLIVDPSDKAFYFEIDLQQAQYSRGGKSLVATTEEALRTAILPLIPLIV